MLHMLNTIKCEFRIALSKNAQPTWFRVAKWTVLIGGTVFLFDSELFWYWVTGLPLLGMVVHFVYRRQTHCWTRPWGGWSDLEAGR